jgi:hypothetical protein
MFTTEIADLGTRTDGPVANQSNLGWDISLASESLREGHSELAVGAVAGMADSIRNRIENQTSSRDPNAWTLARINLEEDDESHDEYLEYVLRPPLPARDKSYITAVFLSARQSPVKSNLKLNFRGGYWNERSTAWSIAPNSKTNQFVLEKINAIYSDISLHGIRKIPRDCAMDYYIAEERAANPLLKAALENLFVGGSGVKDKRLIDIEEPLERLTAELLPHVKQGEYSCLVGDDTSGRIPTLVLRKVINSEYAKIGLPPIPTYFFHGNLSERKKAELGRRLHDVQVTRSKTKALVITEYMQNGGHVANIKAMLDMAKVKFAVASIALAMPKDSYRGALTRAVQIFSGDEGLDKGRVPRIYGETSLTGISKDYRRVFKDKDARIKVIEARQNVNAISNSLIAYVESLR